MCLMFTLWGASPLGVISNASPLGVISNVSPLGVPADLQSAAVGFSYLQDRDAAFSLEADCKSAGTPSGLVLNFCQEVCSL